MIHISMALSAGPETYGPDMEKKSQELDWDAQMSYMHFCSLPSVRVIPVANTFQSPKSPWCHWRLMTGIWKGQGHAVDGAYTVCLQECPTHSHFDGLQVLSAAILPPCMNSLCASLVWRWRPIRFERIHVILITDCVHTTRAPSRWGASNYPRVAWATSTPSHLLRTGSVPNLHHRPSTLFRGNFSCSYVFNLRRYISGDMVQGFKLRNQA